MRGMQESQRTPCRKQVMFFPKDGSPQPQVVLDYYNRYVSLVAVFRDLTGMETDISFHIMRDNN